MSLHSQFLVHWTGKDFHHAETCHLPIDDVIRQQYVARLRDTCEKGLFMKRGTEIIHGFQSKFTLSIARVCLTEIRLSETRTHASRYGLLGIGFDRTFVMERGGNPVFYVQNGEQGTINRNIAIIGKELDKKNQDLLKLFELILGYFKNMSEPNKTDLIYYDEMEWRIVEASNLTGKYITMEDSQQQIYRLKLTPADIRLLVFPDSDTRQMALNDPILAKYIEKATPIMTTVSDCEHF